MLIDNTIFKNIEDFAIKYIKAISFTKNAGNLKITNSIFSRVSNNEKGSIITSKDLASTKILNSVFENSANIVTPINLSGSGSLISNCLIYSCGKFKTTKGAIQKNIIYKNPKWEDKKNFIPSSKSQLLKGNNNIETIGLIQ